MSEQNQREGNLQQVEQQNKTKWKRNTREKQTNSNGAINWLQWYIDFGVGHDSSWVSIRLFLAIFVEIKPNVMAHLHCRIYCKY